MNLPFYLYKNNHLKRNHQLKISKKKKKKKNNGMVEGGTDILNGLNKGRKNLKKKKKRVLPIMTLKFFQSARKK